VKQGKVDHDAFERETPEPTSIVERRNILKSGLATTIVFAGGTVLSVISCLREIFSPSDDTSESS
jgi:hypothetical protein